MKGALARLSAPRTAWLFGGATVVALAATAVLWAVAGSVHTAAPRTPGAVTPASTPDGTSTPAAPVDPPTPVPTPTGPERTVTGTATIGPSAASPSGSTTPADGDLLKSVEPAPPGAVAQVEIFMGAGPECRDVSEPGPAAVTQPSETQYIPGEIIGCFENFNQDAQLSVFLTPPVGQARYEILPALGPMAVYTFKHRLVPGDPVGTYRLWAEQGAVQASTEFTVALPPGPRVWVEEPVFGVVGVDVNVHLGGFPPRRPATLYVYGSDSGLHLRYRTSFTVPVNDRGEAHILVDTKPDDPTGCYAITSPLIPPPEPPEMWLPDGCGFCLTHRP
jgi:hypothetical protein